jgi:hypothetical protein
LFLAACTDDQLALGGVCDGRIPVAQPIEAVVVKGTALVPVARLTAVELVDASGEPAAFAGAASHDGTGYIELYAPYPSPGGYLRVRTGDDLSAWFHVLADPRELGPTDTCGYTYPSDPPM